MTNLTMKQHSYVVDAQPASLAKLVVHTMRTVYNPPNPVKYGPNRQPWIQSQID